MPEKYVVILEIDTGYIQCVAICDTAEEAYGHALLAVSDDVDEEKYYLTIPQEREGENGYMIECRSKDDNSVYHWCTVLFYEPEDQKGEQNEQKGRYSTP